MDPFYFGEPDAQLYGIYSPPSGNRFEERAVLICSPIAQEYIRSHRALVNLAYKLSADGMHVLRFDYYGCGDSAGDFSEANTQRWVADIKCAKKELQDISGCENVAVIAVRLGASLFIESKIHADPVVLWDPVLDGDNYMTMLNESREYVLKSRGEGARSMVVDGEISGFIYSDSMQRAINSIHVDRSNLAGDYSLHVVMSAINTDYRILQGEETNESPHIDTYLIEDSGEWEDIEGFGTALIPVETINKILKIIS